MKDDDVRAGIDRSKDKNPWKSPYGHHEKEEGTKIWGIFLFGLIGATVTTFAAGQLRRTADWFYQQFSRSQSAGRAGSGKSFRSAFQEEAWKRYRRRMQEEYEEEMERVERIRRMQSVFNRERNKYRRGYEHWRENDAHNTYQYHQNFQREDWYWKADASFRDHNFNYRQAPRHSVGYHLSHHYAVLGLDRSRTDPYTEAEIKSAFRAKALEFHPDQNQDNKALAEAKFKEVLTSYEAIQTERKKMKT